MSIAQKYLNKLREETAWRVESVASGKCENIEKYCYATGEIHGLRQAEDFFLEQLKAQDEIDGTQDSVA